MNDNLNVAGVYYSTMDYGIFKRLPCNRAVTQTRRDRLVESFGKADIICPIVVNEKMEIIDGQGRYEARKKLGLPIMYIIQPGIGVRECMIMNQYNKPWSTTDYIDSYAEAGNENYKRLKQFMKDEEVPASRALYMAGRAYAKQSDVVAYGEMVFTDDDIARARVAIRAAREILEALVFTGRTNEAFYSAVKIMVSTPGYNHEHMITNCKYCRGTYNQMASMGAQLTEFSRIYNYKKKGNRVRFESYMDNKGYAVRDYSSDLAKYLGGNDHTNVSTLTE